MGLTRAGRAAICRAVLLGMVAGVAVSAVYVVTLAFFPRWAPWACGVAGVLAFVWLCRVAAPRPARSSP